MENQDRQPKPEFAFTQVSSLANLLSLRNGGGLDPASVDDFDELDDQMADDLRSCADTTAAELLTSNQNDALRQQFLNRLSELLARDKGGSYVSCAALRENETEGRVDIWVARNCGLKKRSELSDDDDNVLLRTLERTLISVSEREHGSAPIESWLLSAHADEGRKHVQPSVMTFGMSCLSITSRD